MNRRYVALDFVNLVNKIKALIPEIAITTDIMVGFPSETEANFENTIKLIKKIIPLKVHIFPYSLRDKTQASRFKQALDPAIVRKRAIFLKYICAETSLIYKKKFLNKAMDVLIEARSKPNAEYWQGYTKNYIKVEVKSELNLKNKIVSLQLKKIKQDYVLADL